MNNVAVTDGDKVEAEIRLGYHVDNAPIATLVPYVNTVTEAEIDTLIAEYEKLYDFAADCKKVQKNILLSGMLPHRKSDCAVFWKTRKRKRSLPASTSWKE
jgi:hypothetical protein